MSITAQPALCPKPARVTASHLVIGANHRTGSGALREGIATDEVEVPALLERVRALGMAQAVWISTCDRAELHAVHDHPMQAANAALGLMAGRAGVGPAELAGQCMVLTGQAAIRHLFAVAASLDSQVVGEPHVLGQVKAAHRLSVAAGMTGPELEAALQAAYAAAKRVRSETPIAEGATSIVAAAVQVARDVHGRLDRLGALLVGAGDMGVMVVEGLRAAGLGRITAAAPVDRRAESCARRLGGHFAPWSELDAALAAADIVVTGVGLGRYILSAARMEAVQRRRRRRPVFVVDTGVPADVDPEVGQVDAVFVYDLADLERVALEGRVGREAATRAAWAIVDEAVAAFVRDRAERTAVPAVAALRARFEAERRRVLAEHTELDAAAATRLLINRLLHDPSEVLRGLAAADRAAGAGAAMVDPRAADFGAADFGASGLGEGAAAERLLTRLFRLDGVADARTEDERT